MTKQYTSATEILQAKREVRAREVWGLLCCEWVLIGTFTGTHSGARWKALEYVRARNGGHCDYSVVCTVN